MAKAGRSPGADGRMLSVQLVPPSMLLPTMAVEYPVTEFHVGVVVAAVRAQEGGATASVEGGRRPGVDRQGSDGSVRQAGVDTAPGAAAIEAPEDAAVDARVEGGRRPRVDRHGVELSLGAGVEGTPGRAPVGALEEAAR